MQTIFNGKTYRILFQRFQDMRPTRPITSWENAPAPHMTPKRYLSTRIMLLTKELGGEWQEVDSATVGCYHKDSYSHEQGRRDALKRLLAKYAGEEQRAFRAAIGHAYSTRPHAKNPGREVALNPGREVALKILAMDLKTVAAAAAPILPIRHTAQLYAIVDGLRTIAAGLR